MVKKDPAETATLRSDEPPESEEPRGGELYPSSPAAHTKLLNWCLEEFGAADAVRAPLVTRWRRYWKLYRSYVARRKGDWRSKVFIPIAFYVIEAIVPRMVAQLPKFIVEPVGETDEEGSKVMEHLLEWSAKRTNLYLELVKVYKSALKYGTGIAKVRHVHRTRTVKEQVPEMAQQMMPSPVIDPETGQPMTDITGQPMMEDMAMGPEVETGNTLTTTTERVIYDGPVAEYVDIFNFWPSPEATSIEDARYVIQRVFRDSKYVQKMLDDGIWRLPDDMDVEELWSNEKPDVTKLQAETGHAAEDPSRKLAEVWEFWTDDAMIVVLNRIAVVRVDENPFEHGEKPFIRVVDYFQEGEFWGIGEIEPLEGMQDLTNALWNQRIDNVRLVMNRMFAFDPDNIVDTRDLAIRPGGGIRVRSKDIPPRDVIQWLDVPDVTSSSYTEVAEIERMTEKISGVSGYTTGVDAPTMNQTATGVSIITEQGNTRFSLKIRMAELTGLGPLARMFGSILQQFMPDEMSLRILDEQGNAQWETITADSIQGGYDYYIEAESSTVTESVRKEQAMNLMQTFAQVIDPTTGMPVLNLQSLAEDVLDAFGKKNKVRYEPAPPPPPPPMQEMGPAPGEEMPPGMDPNMDPNAILDAMMAQGPPQ